MSRIAIGLLAACVFLTLQAKELTYYVDIERPNVTYFNPRYVRDVRMTSRRFSRRDPVHYVQFRAETLVPFGNNLTLDGYVYEFLSNEYRRSFLEIHFKLCDILETKQLLLDLPQIFHINQSCPFAKGVYQFTNLSCPDVPLLRTFPFTKGRGFLNYTLTSTGELLGSLHVDLEIKHRWR